MTVGAGPAIGAREAHGNGVTMFVEYTLLAHEPIQGEHRSLGIGATSAVEGGWQSNAAGWNGAGYVGIDYVPFLTRNGHVTMGGLVGYGAREDGHEVMGMVPRFGLAITPWSWGEATVGMGGRVQCSLAVSGDFSACGPVFLVSRVQLGK